MTDTENRRFAQLLQRQLWIRQFAPALIPQEVSHVLRVLDSSGERSYVVGGCVRDLLLQREPGDWDLASSARPGKVRQLFCRTIPTGVEHGTVTVLRNEHHIEVTTFRTEGSYSDHRRPDWVRFTNHLEDDLGRRDFTINAMAMDRCGGLYDPYHGLRAMACKSIQTVGKPAKRFSEDALRMMRAVRFAAELDFDIEKRTEQAIRCNCQLLEEVAPERIRQELDRLMLSAKPAWGIRLMARTGLLQQFWPELMEGQGVVQNIHHAHTVWEHSVQTLSAMARRSDSLKMRLAALLHDVAKPRCMSADEDGSRHFYNHHVVGAAVARRMLQRLRYDNRTTDGVTHLIRHHMALHHYPQMKDAAIRRLINRVGVANISDLVQLRIADRLGSGTKDTPLSRGARRLLDRIDRVLTEDAAFGLGDLAVDGNDVMLQGGLDPGPEVGRVLETLLDEVLENPSLNTRPALIQRIRELTDGSDQQ